MIDKIIEKLLYKKIIIIGLGNQGKKIINFFIHLGLKDNIIGICNTNKTKIFIENNFYIKVSLDYINIIKKYKNEIGFIFIGVKPYFKQEEIYEYVNRMYINIPVLIEKSFISNKKINLINKKHPTGIIIEEYSYMSFYKNIYNVKDSITGIDIISELNSEIYNQIINKKLSLISYIYGYIYILNLIFIKLLSITKIELGYKILLLINGNIIINILLKNTERKYNYNTIIYKHINNSKSVFNINSQYFIFNGKKEFNNVKYGYFNIFLENKIFNLLNFKSILKEDLKKIQKFNTVNYCDEYIDFFN